MFGEQSYGHLSLNAGANKRGYFNLSDHAPSMSKTHVHEITNEGKLGMEGEIDIWRCWVGILLPLLTETRIADASRTEMLSSEGREDCLLNYRMREGIYAHADECALC